MSNTDVKEPVEKLSQETNVEEGMAAAGTDAVDESATESEREDARADEPEANTAGNDVISNDAPANAPAATTTGDSTATDFEARIAEAEQRGYLRGRNESIAELMRKPGVLERMPDVRHYNPLDTDSEIMVLTSERVSIWDK